MRTRNRRFPNFKKVVSRFTRKLRSQNPVVTIEPAPNPVVTPRPAPKPESWRYVPGSESESKTKSKTKSKSKKRHILDPTDIIILKSSDINNTQKLKDEINRLNTLNEKLTHQIFNLKEEITSTTEKKICKEEKIKENEEFKENDDLNIILQNLKKKIIYDVKEKLEKAGIQNEFLEELKKTERNKNFSSMVPKIIDTLKNKAGEKLPGIIFRFVSSKIGEKVKLACHDTEEYLDKKEIEAIANYLIRELTRELTPK